MGFAPLYPSYEANARIETMNFDDTPQEAAFRAEAKAWIAANAPKQYEEELKKSSLGRSQLKGANVLQVAKASLGRNERARAEIHSAKVPDTIRQIPLANHTRRNTCHNGARRYVADYHGTGTDDVILWRCFQVFDIEFHLKDM